MVVAGKLGKNYVTSPNNTIVAFDYVAVLQLSYSNYMH